MILFFCAQVCSHASLHPPPSLFKRERVQGRMKDRRGKHEGEREGKGEDREKGGGGVGARGDRMREWVEKRE